MPVSMASDDIAVEKVTLSRRVWEYLKPAKYGELVQSEKKVMKRKSC